MNVKFKSSYYSLQNKIGQHISARFVHIDTFAYFNISFNLSRMAVCEPFPKCFYQIVCYKETEAEKASYNLKNRRMIDNFMSRERRKIFF